MEERYFIQAKGHLIPMIIAKPDKIVGKIPCILLCHGFMSWKESDGYLFTKLAEKFTAANIATARIDYCSMGENRYNRKNYTLTTMIQETKEAFAFLQSLNEFDNQRLGILGHSLGCKVVQLCSNLPAECFLFLNGALKIGENGWLPACDLDSFEKKGYMIWHTSDNRDELLYKEFYQDLLQYTEKNDFNNEQCNVIVAVGKNDPTVNPTISYHFYDTLKNTNKKLIEIDEANHTFNAKTLDYTKTYELAEKLIDCLKEYL